MTNDGPDPQRGRTIARLAGRFVLLLLVFVAINVAAAQLRSDCGLPAVLGLDACSDDIVRMGWPMGFYEAGGIGYHQYFDTAMLSADAAAGLIGAFLVALASLRLQRRK